AAAPPVRAIREEIDRCWRAERYDQAAPLLEMLLTVVLPEEVAVPARLKLAEAYLLQAFAVRHDRLKEAVPVSEEHVRKRNEEKRLLKRAAENYSRVARASQADRAPPSLSASEWADALMKGGKSYFNLGDFDKAAEMYDRILSFTDGV